MEVMRRVIPGIWGLVINGSVLPNHLCQVQYVREGTTTVYRKGGMSRGWSSPIIEDRSTVTVSIVWIVSDRHLPDLRRSSFGAIFKKIVPGDRDAFLKIVSSFVGYEKGRYICSVELLGAGLNG